MAREMIGMFVTYIIQNYDEERKGNWMEIEWKDSELFQKDIG